jgi:tetratricopeptide (TPR) repeat protein
VGGRLAARAALRGYFDLRGASADWLSVAELSLDAAIRDGDPVAEAGAQINLGQARLVTGDRATAIIHVTRAQTLARAAGWTDGTALACLLVGLAHLDGGRLTSAIDMFADAVVAGRRAGAAAFEAYALDNLATAYRQHGDLVRAEQTVPSALPLYQCSGCVSGEAHAHATLADLCWAFDHPDDARRHADRALTLYVRVGNVVGEWYARYILAGFCPDGGDLESAVRTARSATDVLDRHGERQYLWGAWRRLAELYTRADRPVAARAAAARALRVARAADAPYLTAAALVGLARSGLRVESAARIVEYLDEASALAETAGYRVVRADILALRARVLSDEGRPAEAAAIAGRAAAAYRSTGHRRGERLTAPPVTVLTGRP